MFFLFLINISIDQFYYNPLTSSLTNYNMNFSQDEILITNGGSEALLFSITAIADPGDGILIPEPFYTNYNGFATAVNVNIKPIATFEEEGFQLPSKYAIEKVITEKTRAILLSNPGNPTGALYTKDQIEMIASLAKEHALFIITSSVSKRYSAFGVRIGAIELYKTPKSYFETVNSEYKKRRDIVYNELNKMVKL
ncbi:protein of unknown function [Tepidibacter aestuarii]|nr:protein of unknown function [Tepidibacter aestuarii]